MTFVRNRVKREKAYITRRIKEQEILIKRERVLSQIKVLEIILGISPRITIRKKILKIKHKKILQHQKAGKFLTVMLKIMNIRNL